MESIPIKNKIIMVKRGSIIDVSDDDGNVVEYELIDDLFVQVQYNDHAKVKMKKIVHHNDGKSDKKPKLTLIK